MTARRGSNVTYGTFASLITRVLIQLVALREQIGRTRAPRGMDSPPRWGDDSVLLQEIAMSSLATRSLISRLTLSCIALAVLIWLVDRKRG